MSSNQSPAPPVDLADEPRQFAMLLNSVIDYAIYMLDAEGYVRTWNPGGTRIKGYQADEVIGTHFSRFYTPDDVREGVPMRNLRTAETEGRFSADGWRVRRDGSRFLASVVIDPIWNEGRLIGFAKITRDITERHEAEQQLQATHVALFQAQKMEAIGLLTLGLAHDFNNLLTVVINSLDVIGGRTEDKKIARVLETAMRAADRGVLLTRQLLTFGRGQALMAETINLNDLILDNRDLLRRAAADQVDFHMDLAADLPQVAIDRGQFEAAILNLVSNSRDSLPDGGRISIRTFLRHTRLPQEPPQVERPYICTEVTDNGPGIPAEHQARVFEPFFTTKDVGRGSGLGLSQVFGFASQSGGFTELHSPPGGGTTVCICLPVCENP
ncbi:PAS domain-containing sensor histidine kinase [Luteimonas sp. MC1572]|uniref:two-component system sensor histidine kinase NtrB n=1 Tax=Luteimonas sp. MC1572 TaxID=2799325 RepID=UPI0018F0CCC8|nr:PAS domain-containing sensor histidine kinase [Luteimonas sp. MC1572]MBJ6982757.1 PAS domain S-box protein [Luteimonas sp. MC1572]QQO03993.1 PAS domain S-box protein [Luteimonas sp. MC1572]